MHHGIGDNVSCTPMLEEIILNDSEAKFDLILQKQFYGDLFENFPGVRNIISLENIKKSLFKYVGINKYDYGIIPAFVYDVNKANILLRILGCKKVIYQKDASKWTEHCVIRNLKLIDQLNYKYAVIEPRLYITKSSKKEICDLYCLSYNKRIISFCLGGNTINSPSKENRSMLGVNFKHWPLNHYIKLFRLLGNDIEIVLIGGKKELEECRNELRTYEGTLTNLMGRLTVRESAMVLAISDLAVGNDTGMMHIAGAMSVETLSIHGPTNEKMYGVFNAKAHFIVPNTDCKYCYEWAGEKYFNCKKGIECLNAISPEEVLDSIVRILRK